MTLESSPVLIRSPLGVPVRDTSLPIDAFQTLQEKKENHNMLVISPYHDLPHLLDLSTVGIQEQLLATALTGMDLRLADYTSAPYVDIFNWDEIVDTLRSLSLAAGHAWKKQAFFVVVFRSQIPPSTDRAHLVAMDKAAHIEAVQSGGFLKYWYGEANAEGRNLATCVWRSQEDARLGGVGPAHRLAASSARHLYTEWRIERLALKIGDEVKDWKIVPWIDEV